MSLISVNASCDDTLSLVPSFLLINTTDSFSAVQVSGYLNGQTIISNGFLSTAPGFVDSQLAVVMTSDMGPMIMMVVIDGSSNVSLIPKNFYPSTPSFSTPTFSGTTTASQLSTTRSSQVSYSYNATIAISILAGQSVTATLKYADNSGMSTNAVTVCVASASNSGVLGLSQVNSLNLNGLIPAGKYRQVTFAVTGGASAPSSLVSGQEVLL